MVIRATIGEEGEPRETTERNEQLGMTARLPAASHRAVGTEPIEPRSISVMQAITGRLGPTTAVIRPGIGPMTSKISTSNANPSSPMNRSAGSAVRGRWGA